MRNVKKIHNLKIKHALLHSKRRPFTIPLITICERNSYKDGF